jgi:hypothetical protein
MTKITEHIYFARPFVVRTAFDSIARNWFDSSRRPDKRSAGIFPALTPSPSQ